MTGTVHHFRLPFAVSPPLTGEATPPPPRISTSRRRGPLFRFPRLFNRAESQQSRPDPFAEVPASELRERANRLASRPVATPEDCIEAVRDILRHLPYGYFKQVCVGMGGDVDAAWDWANKERMAA